jgi:hypothetical protein
MDRQKWTNRLASQVPSISHIGIFLVGLCEDIVYQVKINNPQHLEARIQDAVAAVTPNTLQGTWNEVEYRLDMFPATKRAHIKIY